MLLSQAQVDRAMRLTSADIQAMLQRSGYGQDRVIRSVYDGMTADGVFVYTLAYYNDIGEIESTKLYVNYEDDSGKWCLICEY